VANRGLFRGTVWRWVLVLFGALAPLLLPALADAAFPGPNGRLVVVLPDYGANDQGNIWTMNPDGSDPRQLTTGRDWDLWASWSPDGKRIAFTRGLNDIWLMNGDGSNQVPLITGPSEEREPTWSPDGRQIAFTRITDSAQIWIKTLETGEERQVTNFNGFTVLEPAWSPTGDRIAFVGFGNDGYRIYTVTPGGFAQVRITSNRRADRFPEWSPDGKKIIFSRSQSDYYPFPGDLYSTSGGGVEQLITENADRAVWSPDGTKISFLRFDYSTGSGIWVRDLASGAEQRISNSTSYAYLSKPDWQPIVNQPPDCSAATANPKRLWPPNHKFRAVSLGGASDLDGDPVTISIDSVTQDEPVGRAPDAQLGPNSGQLLLRAERDPKGDGRVYTISLTATDGNGGACTARTTVEVRRQQQSPAGDSSPPSYDSFLVGG
jgi:dipeptidyl aminopeptidase/acylaminoacyl peptidase